jgi:hypothetical protein
MLNEHLILKFVNWIYHSYSYNYLQTLKDIRKLTVFYFNIEQANL